jgi:hypothetical protein
MNSHLWWVHATGSPQLVELWSCVSSPLLSHPPQEKNRWFRRSHKARSLIWSRWRFPSWLLHQGWSLVRFIFIFYFVIILPLCNKYSDYCDIYLYTLYYCICCLLGACMRFTRLCSLKPGCDIMPGSPWGIQPTVTGPARISVLRASSVIAFSVMTAYNLPMWEYSGDSLGTQGHKRPYQRIVDTWVPINTPVQCPWEARLTKLLPFPVEPCKLLGRRRRRDPSLDAFAAFVGPTETRQRTGSPFVPYVIGRRPMTRSSHLATSSSMEAHVWSGPL